MWLFLSATIIPVFVSVGLNLFNIQHRWLHFFLIQSEQDLLSIIIQQDILSGNLNIENNDIVISSTDLDVTYSIINNRLRRHHKTYAYISDYAVLKHVSLYNNKQPCVYIETEWNNWGPYCQPQLQPTFR